MRELIIGMIGASSASDSELAAARAIGEEIARRGSILITGGLGGVMEAGARGAFEVGALTVGILPGADRGEANRYIKIAIPTGMGHARNIIIAQSAERLIAVGGGYGTLSEAAIGLKLNKPLVALGGRWRELALEGLIVVDTPEEAIEKLYDGHEPRIGGK